MNLNWKFKLMIMFGIGLATVAFLKLPALQAQTDSKRAVQEIQTSVKHGKITEYPNGVKHIEPTGFALTGAVRDMRTDPETAANTKQKRDERRKEIMRAKGVSEEAIKKEEINRQNAKRIKKALPGAGADTGNGKFQDPLVNKGVGTNAPQVMPTPSLTFDGATNADNQAVVGFQVLPPDTNGDVGPNHYVSSVNLVLKFFNKSGVIVAPTIATNALFNSLPAGDPCRVANDGDPIVLYDTLADRWHISQFALPGFDIGSGNNFQCVALSVTGDPTGAYYVWSYEYPGPAGTINDYPKVGVWTDAYHMTFNQFNPGFTGAGFLSQDRPRALIGDPSASAVYFNLNTIDPSSGGLLPGDIDGYVAPPAGLAEVIGEFRADEFGDPSDAIRMYRWVPNFINPGSSTITVLSDVILAPFDGRQPPGRANIEQMGGFALDSIADRSMHRFAYRNFGTFAAPVNSYVGNFSVNVSGVAPTSAATYQAGVRWFEMRRVNDTFSVFDQGTHNLTPGNGATGLNNWMSSIAQDNDGNIGLGFSQAGTTQRADIKIAGRTGGMTAAGTLNEGEALFFAANGSQLSNSSRWGDYSAMNVDPVDGCTFWYTQEYYASTSNAGWSTRVGRFIYPSCTPEPTATITGTITFCSSGLPVNQASVDATGGFNRLTISNGTYLMTVSPGTYTVTANRFPGAVGGTSSVVTVAAGQTATANICLNGVAVLSPAGATLISESCSPANGVIDPGETVTVAFGMQNIGGADTVNAVGTLQNTGGVTGAGVSQNYGVIVAGGPAVSRNFTFTADPTLLCGVNITATVQRQDGATNLGNVTYRLPTGTAGGSPTTRSYTGPPVSVPDADAAGANIVLPVSGISGAVSDLNFRLDALAGCNNVIGNPNASMTHTFVGDLQFKLTSPQGTTVALITNRGAQGVNFCTILLDDDGGFPSVSTIPPTGGVAGNFRPESALSAFDGENPNGNWTLNVADVGPIDVGTLNRYSLVITPRVCSTNCAAPTPTPTPTPRRTQFDFDGDGRADLSVFRPSSLVNGGDFQILNSSNAALVGYSWGLPGDQLAPADYDGDGRTDIAVWRESNQNFFIINSSNNTIRIENFGLAGDVLTVGDWDGDLKADLSTYRAGAQSFFFYRGSLNNPTGSTTFLSWGTTGDRAQRGDFDGDGRQDAAVFRPSNALWYIRQSSNNEGRIESWGLASDRFVPSDYDGDRRTDLAVFRESDRVWYIRQSSNNQPRYEQFGLATDQLVPADYDGDGRADVAVYRSGVWYLLNSSQGVSIAQFGLAGDRPIANAFVQQ